MERLDIDTHGHKAGEGKRARNYIRRELMLILDSDQMRRDVIAIHQPYRTTDGRVVRIVSGNAVYRINLEDYRLKTGDVLVIPPQCICEIMESTPDFAIEVLVLSALPGVKPEEYTRVLPTGLLYLSLNEHDWNRQGQFIHLLATLLDDEGQELTAVSYLILSMMADLRRIVGAAPPVQSQRKMSRGEQTFHHFLRLANKHGYRERNVSFYSERLNITPNHLSAIVRQQSGKTVIDWLTERTMVEACILLRHTDMMIYEIATQLGFPEGTALGRYFRKHMDMTPLQYRESR